MNWRRDWWIWTAVIVAGVLIWWLYRGNYIGSAWSSVKGALFTRTGDNTGPAATGSGGGCVGAPAVAATDSTTGCKGTCC